MMSEAKSVAGWSVLSGVLVALAACSNAKNGPPEDGGTLQDCSVDSDCPNLQLFFCNQSTFTCEPTCRSRAECTAAVRKEFALPFCDTGLGCQCDEGTCVAGLCSADVDCGSGFACRNGGCVEAPTAATAAKCQITPDYVIAKAGERVGFSASFWTATNEAIVPSSGVQWLAKTSGVTNAEARGTTAEFIAGQPGLATPAVEVSAGAANCTATVAVLGPVPTGQLRVVVVNELTGRPVDGATVLVSNITTGAQIGLGTVGADGTAIIPFSGQPAAVTVSVFHAEYGYVSVVHYDAAIGSRDLLFALRRNPLDAFGGYRGTFTGAPSSTNIHAGLAGMSLPGAVTELSVAQLLGPDVPTDIRLTSDLHFDDVPLPSGTFLGYGDSTFKSTFAGQGMAGVCSANVPRLPASVADVESAIVAGRCGTRAGWALSGDVPFSDLPVDAFLGGFDNLNLGALLEKLGPMLKRFRSSVVRDIQFELHPTPGAGPGDPVFDDNSFFTEVNHEFDGVQLGFNFAVQVPPLPKFRDDFMGGVVVLGGADVRGRGLVPLGLGAGVNTEPFDDQVDRQGALPAAGLVLTRMAPTHHGLEGSPYVLGTVAVSLKFLDDASAGVALSGIFERVSENRLRFDPAGDQPVPLSTPFLNVPDGVSYNFPRRTFGAIGTDLSAANIVRIQFTDRLGRRWQVITRPEIAAAGFVLPNPPAAFTDQDRTFDTGLATGERSELTVQALRLRRDNQPIGFKELVEFNGNNADRLGDWMVAVSALDQGRPEISWDTSVPPSNTLARGSEVKLKVRGVRVGTGSSDAVVKIAFSNGNGCLELTITHDPSGGKGEISANLPPACTGTNVVMTAQLYDSQGQTALVPAVKSEFRSVNIQ